MNRTLAIVLALIAVSLVGCAHRQPGGGFWPFF